MEITNKSPWLDEVKLDNKYPEVTTNLSTDVVIVGAGTTGIVSAYLLAKAGKKVVVIEKGSIGSGETSYTTAFITNVIDIAIQRLLKEFGKDKAKLVWKSAIEAINLIEKIISEENIECEFERCPSYYYTLNKKDIEYLRKESEIAKELDFEAEFIENDPSIGFDNLAYIRFDNQAKFQPREFLLQLADKAVKYGAKIFENTTILEYCCQSPTKVKTSKFEITADYSILATHIPNQSFIDVVSRLKPKQTYVLEAWTNEDLRTKEGLYWDTNEPYYYFRVDKTKELTRIIIGGRDHLTGKETEIPIEERYEKIQEYLSSIYPDISFEAKNRWSGQIYESVDGLPFIGQNILNEKQLIGTGFDGDGMVFGPLSAKLNSDLILGVENPYSELYSSKRIKNTKSIIKRGVEFADGAIFKKFLLPSDDEIRNIVLDSGKVVKINGKPVAVYKDSKGELKKVSALCTHQGCVVKWNQSERSWDCPCHGSKFTTEGDVITGPADKPLETIE